MALTPISLPRLQRGVPIVDNTGKPSGAFVRYWNLDILGGLERTLNDLAAVQADILAVQTEQAAQLVLIEQAQADIAAQVLQIQAVLGLVQGAAQAANNAQETADAALGTGTVSGSDTDPSVSLIANGVWVPGPIVNLTAVLAGDLTISGTGPLQDSDVDVTGGTATCEFRVVEVIGGVDTMPAKFTGNFSVIEGAFPATVTNFSSAAVTSYSSAETSTGAVSYRIDARKTAGGTVSDLSLYIYARRAV